MAHRCVNAFVFGEKVYPGGLLVEDSDPILGSHGSHFAKVNDTGPGVRSETATAGPSEVRVARVVDPQLEAAAAAEAAAAQNEADTAAWLAAEDQYLEDVAVWLEAEEKHEAAQRAAAEAPETQSPPKPGELDPDAPQVGPVTEAPKRRGGRPRAGGAK